MTDCLFCKIVAGEIPSAKIYEDEFVYAFADIDPKAPFHAIVIPKEHISSADEINAQNKSRKSRFVKSIISEVVNAESRLQPEEIETVRGEIVEEDETPLYKPAPKDE